VLLASSPEAGAEVDDRVLLAELLALRTVLMNLLFSISKGEPVTAEGMQALIESCTHVNACGSGGSFRLTAILQTGRDAHLNQCLSHSSLQRSLSFRNPRRIVLFRNLHRLVCQHFGQVLHTGPAQKLGHCKGIA
jgi:hypothetical protein